LDEILWVYELTLAKTFGAGRRSIGGNWCVLEHFLGFQPKFQFYRFL